MNQIVYVIGDTHGSWGRLNQFINNKIRFDDDVNDMIDNGEEVEVLIIQLGDFGWMPNRDGMPWYPGGPKWHQYKINNDVPFLKDGRVKIYFCDGNHENHDSLDRLEADNPETPHIEVMPGVYFARFGSTLTLSDSSVLLFCGGADSIDKDVRTPGDTWWPQETVSMADMMNLPDPKETFVDYVISHTCPSFIELEKMMRWGPVECEDPSREYLDQVFEMYKPCRWYFGHWHVLYKETSGDCRFICLPNIEEGGNRWWKRIL